MSDRRSTYLAAAMAEVPHHDDWMTRPERDRIERFRYTKRRDETRLGRWTAKCAIAHVLERPDHPDELRKLVVRNASDGAPEAFEDDRPLPVRISMTDRADWAVCIVSTGADAVGCDLEVVEPRSERFVEDWFTTVERRLVAERPHEAALLANLIWSAKESALKVMRTGLRRDTRSVEVVLTSDEHADGWHGLRITADDGPTFHGWWQQFGRFVLTCSTERPAPPPASVLEPPPLLTAAPTHAWMTAPVVTARDERRPTDTTE